MDGFGRRGSKSITEGHTIALLQLYEISEILKLLEAENRILVARGWEQGEVGSCTMGKMLES